MQSLYKPSAGLSSSFAHLPPCLSLRRASYLRTPFHAIPLLRTSISSPLVAAHQPPSFLGTFASPAFSYGTSQNDLDDPAEQAKRSQVSKRLESLARYFRQLGTLGFWGQLVCTVVSAVILAFSVAISGTPTSQATFYLTAGGITAAFLSVFWSFGYIRLSKRLRDTVHDLKNAPPRSEVVNQLKTGIIINLLGMGLTLLGMEATVGTLVAKALTSTSAPYFQGTPTGYSPVLALDVFLVQASANTVLSHFLGLLFSLELLRSVTSPPPPPENVIPKPA